MYQKKDELDEAWVYIVKAKKHSKDDPLIH
jgi:hypothetical protein